MTDTHRELFEPHIHQSFTIILQNNRIGKPYGIALLKAEFTHDCDIRSSRW